MQITQVHIRAYSQHKRNYRSQRSGDMKTFVEGTAIKITMVLDITDATCTISIDDPCRIVVVDSAGMTKEADYVYSYVYQTVANHFGEGEWLITVKATSGGNTVLTQDKFRLLDNRRLATI